MSAQRGHIEAIDGLRSIAVLSIVLFHINAAWVPGGFVGVDIFFVISGFVVAYSVKSAVGKGFFEYFFWFYRRRIIRIYPALLVCVLVTVAIIVLLLPKGYSNEGLITTGLWSLVALSNIKLYRSATSYFDAISEYNPFTHTWSLAVEEQYYVLFPIFSYFMLIAVARRRTRAMLLEWIMVALFALSFGACVYFSYANPSFAFYMVITRFWELLLGYFIAYAIVAEPKIAIFRTLRTLSPGRYANAGALLLLVVTFVLADERAFPFPWAIAPCLAAFVLILSAYRNDLRGGIGFLQHPLALWFGRISYSLYLWHWVVVVFMRWLVGIDTLPTQIVAAVLMLGLACASYYGVESPIRSWNGFRTMRHGSFYGAFAVVIVVSLAAARYSEALQPMVSLSQTWRVEKWGVGLPSGYHPPALPDGCAVDVGKGAPGDGSVPETYSPASCADMRPQRLFVIGDSHADAYGRAAYFMASQERMKVIVFAQAGCRSLSMYLRPISSSCEEFLNKSLGFVLRDAKPGDILFLPGLNVQRYRYYWSEPIIKTEELNLNTDPQVLASAVEAGFARIKPLLDKGVSIILELPKPMLTVATFRCADWYTVSNTYCKVLPATRDDEMARRQPVVSLFSAISARSEAISTWDPFPILCTSDVCEAYKDGIPLYIDTDHVSPYGNDILFPSLRAAVLATIKPR